MENNKVEHYSKLLKEHDWYYIQSDDERHYDKGYAELQEIKKLKSEINLSHNGLGDVLFKEASPFEK